jgi:hypothetical protein
MRKESELVTREYSMQCHPTDWWRAWLQLAREGGGERVAMRRVAEDSWL